MPCLVLREVALTPCPFRHVFLLHAISAMSKVLDRLLWITVIANSLIWPVRLAFYWEEMDEEFLSGNMNWRWAWFGYVTDFVLVMDLALKFNTGYVREHDYVSTSSQRTQHQP